ncbi:hypothetical protein C7K25_07185 [Gulosibacter molinativorax]|uniref:CueP family metal-binding protein n=2 Tax=Gulosibacter molinativorax TaxID=256821 RepID=A0ABT7C7I4_9MICO|nr:hypothetical protein [Gulosibacter molinativorax]
MLILAAVAATTLGLSGCAASTPASTPAHSQVQTQASGDMLADHGLAGLDAPEIIEQLDTLPIAERPTNLIASVQPGALVLTDDQQRETQLEMPANQVYISVAPYQNQTHDCYYHSLTTCVGELGNEDVQVTLTGSDGEVLIDETRQTYDNGFVGMWVPRGIEAELTVTLGESTGSAPISTVNSDDPTCITTLQLS